MKRPGQGLALCVALSLLGAGLFAGCAAPKAAFLVPDFSSRRIVTIAILPIEGAIVDEGSDPHLEEMIAKAIQKRDYRVQNVEETRQALKGKGLVGEALVDASPKDLAAFLGVDAILSARLVRYSDAYYVVARRSVLEMYLALFDGRTNDVLWREGIQRELNNWSGPLMTMENPVPYWILFLCKTLPSGESSEEASAIAPEGSIGGSHWLLGNWEGKWSDLNLRGSGGIILRITSVEGGGETVRGTSQTFDSRKPSVVQSLRDGRLKDGELVYWIGTAMYTLRLQEPRGELKGRRVGENREAEVILSKRR